jgi:hypothetical protein
MSRLAIKCHFNTLGTSPEEIIQDVSFAFGEPFCLEGDMTDIPEIAFNRMDIHLHEDMRTEQTASPSQALTVV